LIAEFMGLECDIMDGKLILRAKGKRYWYGKLYDEDWNSLMPVVERVEAVLKDETLFANSIDANLSILNSNHASIFSPREIVWEYVIQFITWYNQQNT
jgi:hypothetical protein